MERPKVIVCGAGIGGLTVAHELSKRNYDVTIYERNNIVGGLARSKYHSEKGKKYPVEYSWRVYGKSYRNLFRLFKEIPLRKNKEKSMLNNLGKIWVFIFPRFNKEEVIFSKHTSKNKVDLLRSFEKGDLQKILNKLLYCLTMSTDRMDSLDHIKWKDFCKDVSPEARKYLVQFWGPILGMDPTYMSFPVVAREAGILLGGFLGLPASLSLMNKPTNDGWFDEWTSYLKNKKGVKIKTNCEITDLNIKNGKIGHVLIKDLTKKKIFKDQAENYVCGMSVEAIARLVQKNKELSGFPTLKNTIKLAGKSKQIQLSVQIFLDKKLKYPSEENSIQYLPDTPWALIIEPQAKVWGKTYSTDKRVKSVLSVGICQTDIPGIVYKKPFTKCSKKEVENEVWKQITKSYSMSTILTDTGEKIDKAKIVLFYVWDSFKFNKKKGVEIWEPKFSNNADSLQYQPSHSTEIPNFLFATAYTKTNRFNYSMEAAVEAGTLCANEILHKDNKKNGTSMKLTKTYPSIINILLLKPLLWIDKALYTLHLPHLSKATFNSSLVLVGLYGLVIISLAGLLIKQFI